MSFPAKFPGRCDDCRKAISPGDDVEYKDAHPLRGRVLVHVVCDEAPEEPTQLDRDAQQPVCPKHWMIPPCVDCEVT